MSVWAWIANELPRPLLPAPCREKLFNQLSQIWFHSLGDMMAILRKMYGKVCWENAMSMLNKFVFPQKIFFRALSCESPLWAPKGDAVCTVGSLRVPFMGDILSVGVPSHRADFIDQSRKLCCTEMGHNVAMYTPAGIFISQDEIEWSNWLTGDQKCACHSTMPLPGSSHTPGPAWNRLLAIQSQPSFTNLKNIVTVIGTSGYHANNCSIPKLDHLAYRNSGSNLQYSPEDCI